MPSGRVLPTGLPPPGFAESGSVAAVVSPLFIAFARFIV